jgi:hypothetical protein
MYSKKTNNIHTYITISFGLVFSLFSELALSETKTPSKPSTSAKSLPAMTESYKKEIQNMMYETLRENPVFEKINNESKDLLVNCISVRLTDSLWNSKAFKETRSFEDIKSNEAIKNAFEYCELLVAASASLKLNEANKKENLSSSMSFNDLYLDYNQLRGKAVQVSGYLMTAGDYAIMTEKQGATTMIYVDTSNMSREDRKKILDECSSGCMMDFEGVVNDVMYQKGIKLTSLR